MLTTGRERFGEKCEYVKGLVRKAKATYYTDKLDGCSGDQRNLFEIVQKFRGCSKNAGLPQFTNTENLAQTFNTSFTIRIAKIRSASSSL